jgi:uncharacterized membrane protein YdjX (TVP38/TMEM64 family)
VKLRLALVGIAVVLCIVGAASGSSFTSWLSDFSATLRAYGLPGVSLFLGMYVAGTMVLVPAWTFSLAAGLLYGVWGIPLSWAAMMAGAGIAFPLARGVLAGPVQRAIRQKPRLRLVADVIDQEGWRMVLLIRVSGIVPFGLQNYVLGVTRIDFLPFLLASAIGVLPSILLYAGAGAFGQATFSAPETTSLKTAVLALSALAAVALVLVTARRIREKLKG